MSNVVPLPQNVKLDILRLGFMPNGSLAIIEGDLPTFLRRGLVKTFAALAEMPEIKGLDRNAEAFASDMEEKIMDLDANIVVKILDDAPVGVIQKSQ